MGSRPIVKTVNGHELGDVVSALQKAIRRGQVDDALYWAVDMDLTGYGNWLWSRLRIIASEDVGPVDIQAVSTVRALYENWRDAKKSKNEHCPERLFIVHAIWALCLASKSRVVDHSLIVAYGDHTRRRREVPDYALDGHTRIGRMRMKTVAERVGFFYEQGTLVFPTGADIHPLIQEDGSLEDHYREKAWALQEEGVDLPPAPGDDPQGRLT